MVNVRRITAVAIPLVADAPTRATAARCRRTVRLRAAGVAALHPRTRSAERCGPGEVVPREEMVAKIGPPPVRRSDLL
jgi:2-methylisocitrate lyase-like PEP mutase family enzyme